MECSSFYSSNYTISSYLFIRSLVYICPAGQRPISASLSPRLLEAPISRLLLLIDLHSPLWIENCGSKAQFLECLDI